MKTTLQKRFLTRKNVHNLFLDVSYTNAQDKIFNWLYWN